MYCCNYRKEKKTAKTGTNKKLYKKERKKRRKAAVVRDTDRFAEVAGYSSPSCSLFHKRWVSILHDTLVPIDAQRRDHQLSQHDQQVICQQHPTARCLIHLHQQPALPHNSTHSNSTVGSEGHSRTVAIYSTGKICLKHPLCPLTLLFFVPVIIRWVKVTYTSKTDSVQCRLASSRVWNILQKWCPTVIDKVKFHATGTNPQIISLQ